MIDNIEKKEPRSRVKKRSHTYLIVCLVIAAVFTAAFYFYIKSISSKSLSEEMVRSEQTLIEQAQEDHQVTLTDQSEKPTTLEPPSQGTINKTTENSPDLTKDSQGSENFVTSADLSSNGQQNINYEQQLITNINDFYSHLDNQAYMKAYKLEVSSKEHFSSLLQKLLDNPPVVSRETDDLFTLLKNTAHFFRVLGKNNLLMLKGILDREKDSFEKILKSFYSLTSYPDYLKKEYALLIPDASLYDYSGFFLNTMGGRLYLFRRDSTSRMLVSFYSILVIDRVKDSGHDRHGLELSRPIDSLIEEIENTGKRLRLKEEYLDILYDLKEKYSY